MTDGGTLAELPLVERFPALSRIPRARLATLPTPVEPWSASEGAPFAGALWVKRDDLSAPSIGGNKVRALEFLLGDVEAGDTVITVGGDGSTHVLATAHHAARLGARTVAMRWRHEMNPEATAVARAAEGACARVTTSRTIVGAAARAVWRRMRDRRMHWIPLGGSTPLGILGHVNAALELGRQIEGGELPRPERVVVPLGSGGTAAGLALGFAVAGLRIPVVGARVGPRIAVNLRRVRALARATAAYMARHTGEGIPGIAAGAVSVVHDVYGGAYGRAHPLGNEAAARLLDWRGVVVDGTYSAKALAAAVAIARQSEGPTLFWLTFDGRLLARSS